MHLNYFHNNQIHPNWLGRDLRKFYLNYIQNFLHYTTKYGALDLL
jgi:hypothetical protein